MQVFPTRNQFTANPARAHLLNMLEAREHALELSGGIIYNAFPLYRDEEGGVVIADCILISPSHGVVAFGVSEARETLSKDELQRCTDIVEQVPPYIQSRLIKNRRLRGGPTILLLNISPIVFAPFLPQTERPNGMVVVASETEVSSFLNELKQDKPLSEDVFSELVSTIEGAKGLIRPKKRELNTQVDSSKGKHAEQIEAAITVFDHQQKHGFMGMVTGPSRIRGLAGSGKTVVLAMKAALTHLQHPEAKIAYTFCTKSLYQHVKRLITRFYRQFDDKDPDWDNHLYVLHGWGSHDTPGLYSVACERNDITPMTFQEAGALTLGDRFDYACTELLKKKPKPLFDFVFVDEGQDFPLSFIQLCFSLSIKGKFVLAYDDLQTIFQPTTPSTSQIFGIDATTGQPLVTFEDDIVLNRCYRNPREILVTAHAVGFGIYGKRIVQMLESSDHWEDIGYKVRMGDFTEDSDIKVERPLENSLTVISDHRTFDDIVSCSVHEGIDIEAEFVAKSIRADIADGLRPDDVLVVSVDDRNAKRYLTAIERALLVVGIASNNLHSDTFGIRDFSKEGRVTLATVHKAKGNEAFMVYVVGVDAVMYQADVRKRNMLFTAMTRAKGWVRVSGIGENASIFKEELNKAKLHFPNLEFKYPGPAQLKIMHRDLAAAADKRLRARRMIEQLQQEFTEQEIEEMMLSGRPSTKSQHKPRRK